jgi:site-specific recombinase XerD
LTGGLLIPKVIEAMLDYLTPDETLVILRTARSHSARDWAMILLAYRHGMRASEICALELNDVNLKESFLSIRRLKGSLNTTQPLYRHKGQPLLDEVTALRSWFRERRSDGSTFLFLSQKGGRIHRSQFFRIFRACAVAAGLTRAKRHPHVLKHSLASH